MGMAQQAMEKRGRVPSHSRNVGQVGSGPIHRVHHPRDSCGDSRSCWVLGRRQGKLRDRSLPMPMSLRIGEALWEGVSLG